ncbi:ribonuclease p protein subunit p38 [Plakobranchus ocellatus]|uniref:Ribonuclease p protein subunit p38 n=1 Tax=Plakobranchus ocellatus TaxID=259542 RepID=A0AAV3Z123_9GAST|nr:ribonuclease p protein subunit p38 [Plakobranchus ocellatus]
MAAPVVPKSKAKANLNTLVSKEKSAKLTQKHVLCAYKHPWPRPSEQVEESILWKLTETLKTLPNIFHSTKTSEADADKSKKALVRGQLQIGLSSVLRALERDDLRCVLVSGKAKPAITVDHVISLARDRGCPLLCLDGLSATLATALKSKTLPLCIGFRKLQEDQQSEFGSVISLIEENVQSLPSTSTDKITNAEIDEKGNGETADDFTGAVHVPIQQSLEPFRPSKNGGQQRYIKIKSEDAACLLAEIKRVFSSALAKPPLPSSSSKHAKKKKKKQNRHRNVKEPFEKKLHHQFEAGKRIVVGAMERGCLEVVLVSQEVEHVIASLPAFSGNSSKSPPVIILPGLTNMLRVLTSGVCAVSFLGVKKLNLLPANSHRDFEKVLEICSQSQKNNVDPLLSIREAEVDASVLNANNSNLDSKDEKFIDKQPKQRADTETKNAREQEEVENEEEEEEDYSYFYILKKDSKDLADLRSELKNDVVQSEKAKTFSSDFISLSAVQWEAATDHTKKSDNSRGLQTKEASSTAQNQSVEGPPVSAEENEAENTTAKSLSTLKQDCKSQESVDFISLPSTLELLKSGSTTQFEEEVMQTPAEEPIGRLILANILSRMRANKETKYEDAKPAENKTAEGKEFSERGDSLSGMFQVDRGGSSTSGSRLTAKGDCNSENSRESTTNNRTALGEDALKSSQGQKDVDYLTLDVAARKKGKSKSLKRTLEQEAGFISFNYTEANIKTMVSNPSKKRKKKK